MAGSWTTDRFPNFADGIRKLVEQHRELEDEPLHLAISYMPVGRDQQHIFLFEVIGGEANLGEHDFFETVFESTSGFRMDEGEKLHLVFANPSEIETALRENWPLAIEVVKSIGLQDFTVLHADEVGNRILGMLKDAANLQSLNHG